MAEEWDVFGMLPGDDAPTLLATLYEAYHKSIRVELDGPATGSFAINRTSPECTETILAQGNLVRVRIPEIDPDYLFAFFLETGDFTLISAQEKGGEMLTFGGRGILVYTEFAVAWFESFVTGGQDPVDNVWRAYLAGTGARPGQILNRMLEEMQHADRPQQPLPHLTTDFDYDADSAGQAWLTTQATNEFSYQVGETGLAIIERLRPTGIVLQMDPDFTLHAWNPVNFGRDLTGDAFGAGVVRFERGENVSTELRRERAQIEDTTHLLVAGEMDHFGRAVASDADDRVTKEGYLAAFGVSSTALAGLGRAELIERGQSHQIVTFPIANRRTANVVLSSPVSIGSPLGPVATAGFYLPGPEGTLGDFWVGDYVRLHTGSGPFDFDEVDLRVKAITISRDDDNKELIVIPELEVEILPSVCPEPTADGSYYPLGGSGNDVNPSGGNVHYMRAGLNEVYTVSPGAVGSWHFPIFGSPSGGVGTTDYAGDCTGNTIRLIVVGDGTMTVHTAEWFGQDKTLVASLYHRAGADGILDSSQTFAAGDDIEVPVSTHAQAFCTHYLSIADAGPGCGVKFGFSGMDWVAE